MINFATRNILIVKLLSILKGDLIFKIGKSTARDIGCRCFISIGLAFATSAVVQLALSSEKPINNADSNLIQDGVVMSFVGMCLLAPLIENTILCVICFSLFKINKNKILVVALPALLLAGTHAFISWRWALTVFPSFFILTATIFAYRARSYTQAFFVILCIHFLQNSVAFVAILISTN